MKKTIVAMLISIMTLPCIAQNMHSNTGSQPQQQNRSNNTINGNNARSANDTGKNNSRNQNKKKPTDKTNNKKENTNKNTGRDNMMNNHDSHNKSNSEIRQ